MLLVLTTLLDHLLDCLVPPHPQDEEEGERAYGKNDEPQVVGRVAVVDEHNLGEEAAEGQKEGQEVPKLVEEG